MCALRGKHACREVWQNHPMWEERWQRNGRVRWGGQDILTQNSPDISRKYFCRQEPASSDLQCDRTGVCRPKEMDVLGNSQKNSNLFPKKFLERLIKLLITWQKGVWPNFTLLCCSFL